MRKPIAALFLVAILAGCNAASSSPTPAGGSSAAASPSSPGNAAASPGPAAGGPLVEKTVAILTADPFVGHVEQHATASTTGGSAATTVDATLSIDVDGDDIAGHVEAKSPTPTSLDLVVIGDSAYVKQAGTWTGPVPRSVVAESLASLRAAFALVTSASQLREVGVEPIEGQQLHHLTKAATIPYSTSAGAQGEYDVFDLWVDDAGTPVLLRATFSGGNGTVTLSGTTELRFSKMGGPITIVLPADVPRPSA